MPQSMRVTSAPGTPTVLYRSAAPCPAVAGAGPRERPKGPTLGAASESNRPNAVAVVR